MDGVLVVDKPVGPTSHDVVAKVRRALKEKKVGHTGTLDPMATGVLPLVLGRATKIARFLTGSRKVYAATIRLGRSTTTMDAEGETLEEHPVAVSEAQIRSVLEAFRGDIEQIPPMYSAKKLDGRPLYELARQGVEVEREPKQVHIHDIQLQQLASPDVQVHLTCSAGTYVRALAHDVGAKLGCGGHLFALRRIGSGVFAQDDAVPLEQVMQSPQTAREQILPLSRALRELPSVDVPKHLGRMLVQGHQLTVADLRAADVTAFGPDAYVTLSMGDGQLLAVARSLIGTDALGQARRDAQALKTERVVTTAQELGV